MSRSSAYDLAEDVAHVTFAMLEALNCYPEDTLPGGYRFHRFDGFPAFCDHAARAGLILHRAFRKLDRDEWIDIVIDFAETVIGHAIDHGVADDATLAAQARCARQNAVAAGIARRRWS